MLTNRHRPVAYLPGGGRLVIEILDTEPDPGYGPRYERRELWEFTATARGLDVRLVSVAWLDHDPATNSFVPSVVPAAFQREHTERNPDRAANAAIRFRAWVAYQVLVAGLHPLPEGAPAPEPDPAHWLYPVLTRPPAEEPDAAPLDPASDVLAAILAKARVSISALARDIGVSRSHLSRVASGQRGFGSRPDRPHLDMVTGQAPGCGLSVPVLAKLEVWCRARGLAAEAEWARLQAMLSRHAREVIGGRR